MKQKKIHTQ